MADDDDESSGVMGKLIKYSVILSISVIFPPFLLFYFMWKYVKMCVKFYFKALYLIIRLPIWLFIQLPLHYLGVSMHAVSNAFSNAYGVIKVKKKRYGLLFGVMFLLMLQAFLPRNTDAVMSFLTEATLIVPFIVLIPFVITFFIAFISAHFHTPDIARKERPGGLDTGMKSGAATGAAAAAMAGQVGMKAYNNKDEIKAVKEVGETILADDMASVLAGMPLIGSMVGGGGTAAAGGAGGAAAGAAAGTGGTALIVIIAALFLAILGFFAISAVLTVFLWGTLMWLTSVLAPLMSPIIGAIGLGQAYGNWFGSEVANNFLPQVDLTAEMRMVEQAGAKVGCALQGPACLRQWRLNNTARPGSEDVGEKYRLEIQEFSVGGQGGLDIAYKRPEYEVPVNFLLFNTRHGLKGIDARDVNWRVRIIDADREGKKAYCSTGWEEVPQSIGRSEEGTILPGTSFSPRLSSLEDLTLKECEFLQPALGHDYTGELDVKYNYSSQSTLYVRAMSRKNMKDEGLTPGFKKSETADTPVETYINVKEPITYVEPEDPDEDSRSIPFTVKVGTSTDRYDVEYRVHPDDFEVIDSSRTDYNSDSCIGLDQGSKPGENTFGLSSLAQARMNNRIEPDNTATWFDSAKNPAAARCTFSLNEPETISPTGETLTMRVDANYTVVIEDTSDPFEVRNTMCSQLNCPILFYADSQEFVGMVEKWGVPPEKWVYENDDDYDPSLNTSYLAYKRAKCDGIDAGNGCEAVNSYQYEDVYADSQTTAIENGELAVEWSPGTAKAGNVFACSLRAGNGDFGAEAVGVPLDELDQVMDNPNKVLEYDDGELITHNYEQKISKELFAKVPDWIAKAEYSETKKAVGCKKGEPTYEIDCRNIDVEGIGATDITEDIIGGALYLVTSEGSC